MPSSHLSRRNFVISAAGSVMALTGVRYDQAAAEGNPTLAASLEGKQPINNQGKIFTSTKWGMIQAPGSIADKFALMKSLGFDGMELESPIGLDAKEVRAASDATGMPVHGVVNMKHWDARLSDPNPKRREESHNILEECLREANAFGGNTVLLVPGKVTGADETHDHVWDRSIAEIRKTLPTASRLGVRILIENVWNGFCESPEQMRDYLDEIDSPWVGAYFDTGGAYKFAPCEDWIRTLGQRIVKIDIKDWGKSNGFCKIGDGDINWQAVREALAEIGFTGWSTAEVKGGDRDELTDISKRMNGVLGRKS